MTRIFADSARQDIVILEVSADGRRQRFAVARSSLEAAWGLERPSFRDLCRAIAGEVDEIVATRKGGWRPCSRSDKAPIRDFIERRSARG
jgi:hypothetical protein